MDGVIYVMGGGGEDTNVEKLKVGDPEWQTVSSTNHGRYASAAAVLDGLIYVCGGGDPSE